MTKGQRLTLAGLGLAVAGAVIVISVSRMPSAQAQPGTNSDSRIQIGLAAAPVPLNMEGKNPAQVGLGSYFVNVTGDCNGCHSAGPQTEYSPGHNPYLLIPGSKPPVDQPKQVNPATYLGGGRDFGVLGDPHANSFHIVSRNLTPDASGLPEGGDTFEQFVAHMRTGVDDDHLHPTCPVGAVDPSCIPYPFDGRLLQIMPWPNFKDMSDHDLRAIYEYLSAVPCVEGNYPLDPPHRCG
jgi:hypothetical protein